MADISKIVLPNSNEYNVKDMTARSGLASKQDALVSGTNIKTINNTSLLGSGNINISGGGSDVFIVEYGVTTYAEVLAAIENEQKIIIKKKESDGESPDVLYYVNKYEIYDNIIQLYAIGYNSYMQVYIFSNGQWSYNESRFKRNDEFVKLVINYDDNDFYDIATKIQYFDEEMMDTISFIKDPSYGFGLILSYSHSSTSSQYKIEFIALLDSLSNTLPYKIKYTVIKNINTGDVTWSRSSTQLQSKLVSGTSIKTINNSSLLGSGNLSIPTGDVNVQSDWNQTDTTADDYIKNKPASMPASDVYDWAKAATKPTYTAIEVGAQETLVSGTNIKTIHNTSLLGSGNIALSASDVDAVPTTRKVNNKVLSADITLSASDVGAQATLISGTNIKTINNTSLLGAGDISVLDADSTLSAAKLTGAITNGVTATTQSSGDNSTKIATTAYVDRAINDLPEPMVFEGSLGEGGTISTLPTASSTNKGFTYKVITDGTYASQAAKVGDTFISDGTAWVLVPSGDEPSGTVTSVATGVGLTGGPVTSSGTIKANLVSETSQGTIGTTDKLYAVGVDSTGALCASVPWTDTTYESKAAVSGGTDVSLVTTGDKFSWNNKQDLLVSETNIKTINGNSVLGSGDLTISGGLQNLVDGEGEGSVRGKASMATHNYSTALGYGTITNNYYQLVTGIWNINELASDKLFIIGNGTDGNNRSNAFTVDESGNVNIASGASYKINGTPLIDIFYPVGSYYETSDTSFDPNTAWGGTWVLETSGMVHVSAGTGYAVSGANQSDGVGAKDGGSEYVQAHTHDFTDPTYKATGGSVSDKAAFNTNNSGYIANGVPSSGNHNHTAHYTTSNRGSGNTNTRMGPYSRDSYPNNHVATGDAGAHTHNLPNHTHSIPQHGHGFTNPTISVNTNGSVGAINDVTTGTSGNMQPYINVNRWHRTA